MPDAEVSGHAVVTVQVERRIKQAGRPAAPSPEGPGVSPGGPPSPPEEEEEGGADEEPAGRSTFSLGEPVALAAPAPPASSPEQPKPPDAVSATGKKPEVPKPVSREPATWMHAAEADYRAGECEGVTIDSKGRLTLGRESTTLASLPGVIPWALAAGKDGLYLGTGSEGQVYRLSGDQAKPYFATGAVMVSSLLALPDGTLYAGAGPGGKVWRISAEGKGTIALETGTDYVWAMCPDGHGGLWAAAGPTARLWHLAADGKAARTDFDGTHLLSVAADAQGSVYAGAADSGVVFRLAADGTRTTALATDDTAVTALAFDARGTLWAGTSPRGLIYRLPAAGPPERIAELGATVYSLAAGPDGVYATGRDGTVVRLGPEELTTLVYQPKQGQVVSLAADQAGALYLGLANPGSLRRLGPGLARTGSYQSPALDAREVARWGELSWQAELPAGSCVQALTRSGNSADPAQSWSAWSAVSGDRGGPVASAPARFLQYRLALEGDGAASPTVSTVRTSYLPRNGKPKLTVTAPRSGGEYAKSLPVQWKGEDPDKDTLCYRLESSKDNGATWELLKDDLRDPSFTWDLSKLAEGPCLLRITASDRLSRPADPTETQTTIPITVDASAPVVLLLRQSVMVETDGRVTAQGAASDKLGAVRGVDWRVDSGGWSSAAFAGQVIEASQVGFSLTTGKLPAGKHSLEVRAFDRAGNTATDKVDLTVR